MPNVLVSELKLKLNKSPKEIPFCYLYDSKGSELYEKITELEEYYPFLAEERLLKQNAEEIISHLPSKTVVVELGCGTARKTALILQSLIIRDGSCRFAGIDVSAPFLEEARINLMKHVNGLKFEDIELIQAEYLEGLKEVRKRFPSDHLCILWLGSSVGNLTDHQIVEFFQNMDKSIGTNMQLLLCADMWKSPKVLKAAYDDREGVTNEFIKNGLKNAFQSLGIKISNETVSEWIYEAEINTELRRVEMWVRIPEGLNLYDVGPSIRPGERVLVEVSRKFTVSDLTNLAMKSRLCIHAAWRTRQYGIQILVPAASALKLCWKDTDDFFSQVSDWSVKPIDVRHPFLFYFGHAAAFTKLKLFPEENGSEMDVMFSRGIDPLMTDTSVCHSHPEIPSEWPCKIVTQSYVKDIRTRVLSAVSEKKVTMRNVMLSLEHERMHQETLCYMRAQEVKAEFMKMQNKQSFIPKVCSQTNTDFHFPEPDVIISAGKVTMGANEEEAFVWDNEMPRVIDSVSNSFTVSAFPVTVAEFRQFILNIKGYEKSELWDTEDFEFFAKRNQTLPATWSLYDGEYFVHSEKETRHWSEAAEDPVMVSLAEARAFCKALNLRLMTETEWHRIVDSEEGDKIMGIRTDGWEWTDSIFFPFHGFSPMPEYPEYSTDFFDGLHYVLKGSSRVTHPSLCRDSFRNFYQRQYPYLFAKFRVCKSL